MKYDDYIIGSGRARHRRRSRRRRGHVEPVQLDDTLGATDPRARAKFIVKYDSNAAIKYAPRRRLPAELLSSASRPA